jgi:hypothetical protein
MAHKAPPAQLEPRVSALRALLALKALLAFKEALARKA